MLEATTPEALLSLRDVVITADADGRTLLDVPSLDLLPGERVAVTGPSGSGKSLLLNTITGRWPVGVTFDGTRTTALTRIGFVPQRGLDALHPLLPLGRQLNRVSGADPARVAEVLDAVGLQDPELRRRRPTELSGGQAQRAAVALAALTDAPLVLADEPTSALDHESRDLMLRLLLDLLGEGRTLVVTTHDPIVADVLGARRIGVEAGQITEQRAPAQEPGNPSAHPTGTAGDHMRKAG
ncbi:ATP-binding cassette domain-containing protein [Brevibacterium album]|uniref:ATP-binding cassette domain-containing protein n=1 Tax=Brevibacterium album TaxID=417948 RepID=UPI000404026E|nr:ATP-binding cassette domain-containing protein [Brevibacterium album]